MPHSSLSDRIGSVLLALAVALVAVSWYRGASLRAWLPAAVMLAALVLIWIVVFALRRSTNQGAPRRAADPIRHAVLFAASMLVATLAGKLAVDFGLLDGPDFSLRSGMAFLGLFIAFTGNTLPKTLTPLSRLRCDPSRMQALQRLAGWTWVLAGLGYAIVWLAAPIAVAKPASTALVVAALLVVLTQMLRLRRSHGDEA